MPATGGALLPSGVSMPPDMPASAARALLGADGGAAGGGRHEPAWMVAVLPIAA
jgi:hypothetical protein